MGKTRSVGAQCFLTVSKAAGLPDWAGPRRRDSSRRIPTADSRTHGAYLHQVGPDRAAFFAVTSHIGRRFARPVTRENLLTVNKRYFAEVRGSVLRDKHVAIVWDAAGN